MKNYDEDAYKLIRYFVYTNYNKYRDKEDLIQESFLHYLNVKHLYNKEIAAFSTWLYKVLIRFLYKYTNVNLLIKMPKNFSKDNPFIFVKTTKKDENGIELEFLRDENNEFEDLENKLLIEDLFKYLYKFKNKEQFKKIILMVAEGYNFEEIGLYFGTSKQDIQQKYANSIKKIKKYIEHENDEYILINRKGRIIENKVFKGLYNSEIYALKYHKTYKPRKL